METHDPMLAASRRLTEALTPGDLDETLGRITAAAVEVLPDVATPASPSSTVTGGWRPSCRPTT